MAKEKPTYKNTPLYKYREETLTVEGQKYRELVDPKTGEVYEIEQTFKTVYGYQNFWKLSLLTFNNVLEIFDNRQVKVFKYILENTSASDNLFHGSYRTIAEKVDCSIDTVQKIIQKLLKADFFVRVQDGVYLVNPSIMIKGDERKRMKIYEKYTNYKNQKNHNSLHTQSASEQKSSNSEIIDGEQTEG